MYTHQVATGKAKGGSAPSSELDRMSDLAASLARAISHLRLTLTGESAADDRMDVVFDGAPGRMRPPSSANDSKRPPKRPWEENPAHQSRGGQSSAEISGGVNVSMDGGPPLAETGKTNARSATAPGTELTRAQKDMATIRTKRAITVAAAASGTAPKTKYRKRSVSPS